MSLAPVIYIPHGGGPMPLLGDPSHAGLIEFLKALPAKIPTPEAIVVVSGHWEETVPTVMASPKPEMFFDYYGFPPETYQYSYPAAGQPELANKMSELLKSKGIEANLDVTRGYDHGVFVPLLLMYPEANIPTVQLSLIKGLDAEKHIALGEALSSLREQNVLILGSGMSFHNLQALMDTEQDTFFQLSDTFNNWLVQTCSSDQLNKEEQRAFLANWSKAPAGTFCHPRAEHLLPLHVCFGAAKETEKAELIFNDALMGHKVSGFMWS